MEGNCPDVNEVKPVAWGFWATIGFTAVIIVGSFIAQIGVVIGFVVVETARASELDIEALASNGLLLAIATCFSTPPAIALVLLFAWLRKSITVKDYLGLHWPGVGNCLIWVAVAVALAACSDYLSVAIGRPIVSEFVLDIYMTAVFAPLLWFAVIVAAPLGEEISCRGFLLKGVWDSPMGAVGAVVVSAFIWSALHIQYDAYELGTVFVFGLLLGIARINSRSIYIPIIMHAIWNTISTVQVSAYMQTLPD